jgi:hypothetical protein
MKCHDLHIQAVLRQPVESGQSTSRSVLRVTSRDGFGYLEHCAGSIAVRRRRSSTRYRNGAPLMFYDRLRTELMYARKEHLFFSNSLAEDTSGMGHAMGPI